MQLWTRSCTRSPSTLVPCTCVPIAAMATSCLVGLHGLVLTIQGPTNALQPGEHENSFCPLLAGVDSCDWV